MLSGINNGANMGDDTLYSGTVAAATEGYLFGARHCVFPDRRGWGHLDKTARVARRVVEASSGASSGYRPLAAECPHARD